MILDSAALDAHRFSDQTCDALFAAVQVDDAVDDHTELPANIRLDYDDALLVDCYRLCRQLWKTGVDHAELQSLITRLGRERDLSPEDRRRFKHARAKFKHLRFACALFGSGHRYPRILDWMTTAMGHLQDAFKNGRGSEVARHALLTRMFLSTIPRRLLAREVDRLSPSGSANFRAYILDEIEALRTFLSKPTLTGRQFHATRKIISRQVAFYDALRTIEQSENAYLMSRSLAAINGLMGQMHDDLVEQRMAGTFDYHRAPIHLPAEIRSRISALVDRYPAKQAGS